MKDFDDLVTLPDYLEEGLDIVFVGLNPSVYSVEVGHYFANPRNRFWSAFNRSKLIDREVSSLEDATLLCDGIGFTDVVKRPTRQGSGLKVSDYREWAPVLKEKLIKYQPRIASFHGLMGYRAYLKHVENFDGRLELGLQERAIGQARVFVVPNPSPANAKYSLEDLVGWYDRLHELRMELSHEAQLLTEYK
ncbi:MAG TPA: mismatch-specific DNA-glycosylase [Dehalococcoidia bacterium]|nr:mismatch-specific DNA-glycosylase [Dehalococcoidia bacterium]